ncbi:MAG: Uma2 family endonuclease [Haloechinothrix sp.]
MSVTPWPDHLLTLDEWDRLPEDNSRRYELVEGVLIVAPRPAYRHQRAVWRLAAQLEPQLPARWGVLADAEIAIDAGSPPTVRVPDVLVVPEAAIGANWPRCTPEDAVLVVEIVSPGSERTDRTTKFAENAEVGIEHYWIVDLDGPPTLAAYRLIDGEYEQMAGGSGGVELASPVPITVNLDALVSERG